MKIKVTKKDIENGKSCNNKCCPIALAIKRTLRQSENIFVDPICVQINGRYISLPKRAMRFVEKFDVKESVKPFEFNIKLQK